MLADDRAMVLDDVVVGTSVSQAHVAPVLALQSRLCLGVWELVQQLLDRKQLASGGVLGQLHRAKAALQAPERRSCAQLRPAESSLKLGGKMACYWTLQTRAHLAQSVIKEVEVLLVDDRAS